MIFYKEYEGAVGLNNDIYSNPEWRHEVVGYTVAVDEMTGANSYILVKWSPKTKPAEEFKHEQ